MKTRWIGAGVLLAAVGVLAYWTVGRSGGAAPQEQVSPPGRPRVAVENLGKVAWWGDAAIIAELGLSERQRRELDRLLADFLSDRDELENAITVLDGNISEAVERADLDELVRLGTERAALRASQSTLQARWILSALGVLEAPQRAQLARSRPHLLESRWFREIPLGRDRDRRRVRAGDHEAESDSEVSAPAP